MCNTPSYSFARRTDIPKEYFRSDYLTIVMAHLPLREKSDFPEEYQYLLDEEVLGELNLFQVIGHSPEILQSFMKLASTLWEHSEIEEVAREMLTLIVARDLDSRYVWHHHIGIAMDLGAPTDEIRTIGNTEYEVISAVDERLVEFVLAFVRDEVTGEEVARLQNHHSPGAVVSVAMLADHYVSVAKFVDNMDIALEEEFVGWQLERLQGSEGTHG